MWVIWIFLFRNRKNPNEREEMFIKNKNQQDNKISQHMI